MTIYQLTIIRCNSKHVLTARNLMQMATVLVINTTRIHNNNHRSRPQIQIRHQIATLIQLTHPVHHLHQQHNPHQTRMKTKIKILSVLTARNLMQMATVLVIVTASIIHPPRLKHVQMVR
jgi:hypothetical protein